MYSVDVEVAALFCCVMSEGRRQDKGVKENKKSRTHLHSTHSRQLKHAKTYVCGTHPLFNRCSLALWLQQQANVLLKSVLLINTNLSLCYSMATANIHMTLLCDFCFIFLCAMGRVCFFLFLPFHIYTYYFQLQMIDHLIKFAVLSTIFSSLSLSPSFHELLALKIICCTFFRALPCLLTWLPSYAISFLS